MRALLLWVVFAVAVVLGRLVAGDPDPCAGHVTPDGIHADHMGPCDDMPAVP